LVMSQSAAQCELGLGSHIELAQETRIL